MSLLTSFCMHCKHIGNAIIHTTNGREIPCSAFPDGIPDKIFLALKLHNEILLDQQGDYIFTNKKGDENFVPQLNLSEIMPFFSLKEILKKMRDEREKNNP